MTADLDHKVIFPDEGRRDGEHTDLDETLVMCPECNASVHLWEDCPVCVALGLIKEEE